MSTSPAPAGSGLPTRDSDTPDIRPESRGGIAKETISTPSEPAVPGPPANRVLDPGSSQPTDGHPQREKWNSSRLTTIRVITTFWVFFLLGVNDAVIGALLPYLQDDYDVSYVIVSLVFLSPAIGYTTAAILNTIIHTRFGQRGVAIVAGLSHTLAYVVACVRPPFGVLVIALILAGFGSGLHDAAWNAWVGGLASPHQLLGLLHGFYGLGGFMGPMISTFMIASTSLKWYNFYYIVVGTALVETIVATAAFWKSNGPAYREQVGYNDPVPPLEDEETGPVDTSGDSTPKKEEAEVESAHDGNTIRERVSEKEPGAGIARATAPRARGRSMIKDCLTRPPYASIVWLVTIYLFIYAGSEIGIGGWVVTFMLEVRHASKIASGMTSAGYWLGMTAGRMILGFVTPILGDHAAAVYYMLAAVALQLIFWLVPNLYVSAVLVSFIGFFLGPLFPAAVGVATRLLPPRMRVTALGIAISASGVGATLFPFAVGALAQAKGVKVLVPFVMSLLIASLIVWLVLLRVARGQPSWQA